MFKPPMLFVAAFGVCIGQTAFANDHTVHMEEGAFYPEITYLAPGDTVTFINNNPNSTEAIASDESWTTGQLSTGASYMLAIAEDTVLGFSFASDAAKIGSFSFDFAPLGNPDDPDTELLDEGVPESSN